MSKKLQQPGQSFWMMKPPQLLALKWKDTKNVHILSSMSEPEGSGTVQKRQKGTSQRIERPCPPAVIEYRKFMGGVDTHDQLLANTPSLRKSRKWYHPIVFHYLDSAIVNAWILEKFQPDSDNHNKRLIDFKIEIIQELIGFFSSRKRIGRPRLSDQTRYSLTGHLVERQAKRALCACGCGSKVNTWCHSYHCAISIDCFVSFHTPK